MSDSPLSAVCVLTCSQGRKKKPFIDKKKAQTFRLVPRSQQDPLFGEEEESQYVLKPTQVSQYVLKPTQVSQYVLKPNQVSLTAILARGHHVTGVVLPVQNTKPAGGAFLT